MWANKIIHTFLIYMLREVSFEKVYYRELINISFTICIGLICTKIDHLFLLTTELK